MAFKVSKIIKLVEVTAAPTKGTNQNGESNVKVRSVLRRLKPDGSTSTVYWELAATQKEDSGAYEVLAGLKRGNMVLVTSSQSRVSGYFQQDRSEEPVLDEDGNEPKREARAALKLFVNHAMLVNAQPIQEGYSFEVYYGPIGTREERWKLRDVPMNDGTQSVALDLSIPIGGINRKDANGNYETVLDASWLVFTCFGDLAERAFENLHPKSDGVKASNILVVADDFGTYGRAYVSGNGEPQAELRARPQTVVFTDIAYGGDLETNEAEPAAAGTADNSSKKRGGKGKGAATAEPPF